MTEDVKMASFSPLPPDRRRPTSEPEYHYSDKRIYILSIYEPTLLVYSDDTVAFNGIMVAGNAHVFDGVRGYTGPHVSVTLYLKDGSTHVIKTIGEFQWRVCNANKRFTLQKKINGIYDKVHRGRYPEVTMPNRWPVPHVCWEDMREDITSCTKFTKYQS